MQTRPSGGFFDWFRLNYGRCGVYIGGSHVLGKKVARGALDLAHHDFLLIRTVRGVEGLIWGPEKPLTVVGVRVQGGAGNPGEMGLQFEERYIHFPPELGAWAETEDGQAWFAEKRVDEPDVQSIFLATARNKIRMMQKTGKNTSRAAAATAPLLSAGDCFYPGAVYDPESGIFVSTSGWTGDADEMLSFFVLDHVKHLCKLILQLMLRRGHEGYVSLTKLDEAAGTVLAYYGLVS